MAKVEHKKELKAIARLYIKSMIVLGEPQLAFRDSGLTEEEIKYMENYMLRIANSITSQSVELDAHVCVARHLKIENQTSAIDAGSPYNKQKLNLQT